MSVRPDDERGPEPVGPEGGAQARAEAVPGSLWERVQADPARAPEHIAIAAADRFAPAAERWVRREAPHRGPAELARAARTTHVRLSRLEGGIAGLGGGFTVAPDLAALAWLQGRMVFFIAAAYGFDPHHPMRPAELLTLQGIYATPFEARAALDGIGPTLAAQYVSSRRDRDDALASRLFKLVGRTVAKRTMMRIVPILSAPLSAVQNAQATGRLADRTIAYYGGG